MQAVIGFFGSAVAAVVSLLMAAAALTFLVILWKSGSLPVVLGWVGIVLRGIFITIPVAVLGFFGDLLSAAI
jgi:hypothetical protein